MEHISLWLMLNVTLLAGNIDTVNKNTETIINASKEVVLEINQNAGENRNIKIANISFENVQMCCLKFCTLTQDMLVPEIMDTTLYNCMCFVLFISSPATVMAVHSKSSENLLLRNE
jgi:hypothetical protein